MGIPFSPIFLHFPHFSPFFPNFSPCFLEKTRRWRRWRHRRTKPEGGYSNSPVWATLAQNGQKALKKGVTPPNKSNTLIKATLRIRAYTSKFVFWINKGNTPNKGNALEANLLCPNKGNTQIKITLWISFIPNQGNILFWGETLKIGATVRGMGILT